MEIEEIDDNILNTKLLYLNGYLAALEILNSYSIIGMQYKLFGYTLASDGDELTTIRYYSGELFGGGNYNFKLKPTDDWESLIKNELELNFQRRIPGGDNGYLDYSENELVKDLKHQYFSAFDTFTRMLRENLIDEFMPVYVLETDKPYRIIGLDLVFGISDTKIVVLQLMGND